MLTWAFQFEGQPCFDGFRTLATNGIDKPVLNLFRMAGLMQGDGVAGREQFCGELGQRLKDGVQQAPAVDALATRSDRKAAVLVWNYHDDDIPEAWADIRMTVAGVPPTADRVLLRHYRIDETHGNSYADLEADGFAAESDARSICAARSCRATGAV